MQPFILGLSKDLAAKFPTSSMPGIIHSSFVYLFVYMSTGASDKIFLCWLSPKDGQLKDFPPLAESEEWAFDV